MSGEPARDPRRRVIAGVVAVRCLSLLAAFTLSILVSRVLGPADAGVFFTIFTLLALFATVGRFGTDNLALRLLGGDSKTPRSGVKSLGVTAVATGCGAAVLCVPVVLAYSGSSQTAIAALLLCSSVVPQALAVLSGALLRGLGKLSAGVFAELGSIPTMTTMVVLVTSVTSPGDISLWTVLISLTAASWLTALWAFPLAILITRRSLPHVESKAPSLADFLREHARRLTAMMGTSALVYGLVWAPVFVLSIATNSDEVAYYAVAVRLVNLVSIIPAIQISYLAPEFAKLYYSDDLAGLNRLAGRTTYHVSAVSIGPVLALASLAPVVVGTVFGPDFLPAAPVVSLLSVAAYVVLCCGQVSQLMLLCGLENTAVALTLIALIVWAVVGPFVGQQSGAVGVAGIAAVTSIGYAIAASIVLRRSRGIRSYVAPRWRQRT